MANHAKIEKKHVYKKWWFIVLATIVAIPVLVFEIACIAVVPAVLPLEIVLGISIFALVKACKKQKKLKESRLQKEREMLRQGYKKIYNDFFINDKEHKLNILDRVYGFSQILDCELVEDGTSISNTIGNSKIKSSRKMKTNYTTIQTNLCTTLFINITTTDMNNPRIIFNLKDKGGISKSSKKYKEAVNNAQNIISLLKIIIAKNNEKYVETGIITKVEHRYVTEENASMQIEKLAQLYKDGVLTEYEFEIKKKELLEKIK